MTKEELWNAFSDLTVDQRCALPTIGLLAGLESFVENLDALLLVGSFESMTLDDMLEGITALRDDLLDQIEDEANHVEAHVSMINFHVPDYVPEG